MKFKVISGAPPTPELRVITIATAVEKVTQIDERHADIVDIFDGNHSDVVKLALEGIVVVEVDDGSDMVLIISSLIS